MNGLICVAGGKGAPGATTLALALAVTAADGEPVTLVDADPDGGHLAALLAVATTPGVMSLAAASRHRFSHMDVDRHIQHLRGGLKFLGAPAHPDQVAAALTTLGVPFAERLAALPTVADVGRWRPGSPAADLVAAAAVTVLVVQPTVAGVAHARSVHSNLAGRCRRVVVATRGDQPYGPEEVAAALGDGPVVVVPVDRAAVSTVAGQVNRRWWRRSPLARAAQQLMSVAVDLEPVG